MGSMWKVVIKYRLVCLFHLLLLNYDIPGETTVQGSLSYFRNTTYKYSAILSWEIVLSHSRHCLAAALLGARLISRLCSCESGWWFSEPDWSCKSKSRVGSSKFELLSKLELLVNSYRFELLAVSCKFESLVESCKSESLWTLTGMSCSWTLSWSSFLHSRHAGHLFLAHLCWACQVLTHLFVAVWLHDHNPLTSVGAVVDAV